MNTLRHKVTSQTLRLKMCLEKSNRENQSNSRVTSEHVFCIFHTGQERSHRGVLLSLTSLYCPRYEIDESMHFWWQDLIWFDFIHSSFWAPLSPLTSFQEALADGVSISHRCLRFPPDTRPYLVSELLMCTLSNIAMNRFDGGFSKLHNGKVHTWQIPHVKSTHTLLQAFLCKTHSLPVVGEVFRN